MNEEVAKRGVWWKINFEGKQTESWKDCGGCFGEDEEDAPIDNQCVWHMYLALMALYKRIMMILTGIFLGGMAHSESWKIHPTPTRQTADSPMTHVLKFWYTNEEKIKRNWWIIHESMAMAVLWKTNKFFFLNNNSHFLLDSFLQHSLLLLWLLLFLQWDQTNRSKPVAQPFQQTQWTHRPIRLHLLSPATRASMSFSLTLSLQASFTVLFSLSLSALAQHACDDTFLITTSRHGLHFGFFFIPKFI